MRVQYTVHSTTWKAPVVPTHPTYSIVVPVFNEEEVLPEMYRRFSALLDALDAPAEMILVNDGSRDRTPQMLNELAANDPRLKVIHFSRNFGHQVAITAGIDHAEGDAVIVIDADLQDPPEVIHELIAQWKAGGEVVLAVRAKREGETWFKLLTASLFYRVIDRLTDLRIPPDSGDFRLMDRKVVHAMRQLREHHRFMRGLSVWVGFNQRQVSYVRHERFAGTTKYPLRKMLRLANDAITSFSYVPLQLATTVGFIMAGIALLFIPIIAIMRLSGIAAFVGQASTLISVLFLGGVQLVFLGIIGEYLGRMYDELKDRPLYLIANKVGFEQPAESQPQDDPRDSIPA